MAQNAISVCVVVNSRAFVNKAALLANRSEFSCSRPTRKFRRIPFNLRFKNVFDCVEVKLIRPRTIAFGLPNEDDGAISGCSDSSADILPLILDGSDASLEGIEIEEESSFSYSRPDLFDNANQPVSEAELLNKLKAIRLHVLASEQWNSSQIESCHRSYEASATNLIHYAALKSLDIERVKEELSYTDLLNWEINNSCVIASLEAGIKLLESSTRDNKQNISESCSDKRLEKERNRRIAVDLMRNRIASNTRLLLGPLEEEKTTHVMVTVGSEAIENETLIVELVKMGASIIRINCAHGDPSVWSEIIRRVRTSSQMTEKPCRVLMDLAGPKLRTGKLKPGPNVMKISPKKNASGIAIFPAQIWLSHRGAESPPTQISPDATLFIDGPDFLHELVIGDTLRFNDARGKKRVLKISSKYHVFSGVGVVAECTKTSYIESGTQLYVNRKKCKFPFGLVIDVPAAEPCLRLRVGDLLIISRDSSSDRVDSPEASSGGAQTISCPSGLLFDSVKPGEPISFDDGKIQGTIRGASMSEIVVAITHAKPGGSKLGPEKSINIPESNIRFEGLTSKDLVDLEFVASQADMVGVSFVRNAGDIVVLRRELEKRKLRNLGVVLKVETKSGFESLSQMILEAMKSPNPLGVMIARGDLAVECGWERLADTQEEILSVCSAAHLPVVWATQVLESFVKSGVPTRAEITDVSNGRRASCIMLNKGKHIVEAVSFLDAVLRENSAKVRADATPC